MIHGLPEQAVVNLCRVLSQHPEVNSAILYGSRANGNYKPGSDIDLTLKGNNINLQTLNQIDNEIDDLLLPWMVDLSIYSQIENTALVEHIDRVGKLFFQKKNPSLNNEPS